MMSKAVVKSRPTVLWCYRDKLELSRFCILCSVSISLLICLLVQFSVVFLYRAFKTQLLGTIHLEPNTHFSRNVFSRADHTHSCILFNA